MLLLREKWENAIGGAEWGNIIYNNNNNNNNIENHSPHMVYHIKKH